MSRGRPVRIRKDFMADITALGRMRTAIQIDNRLDRNRKAEVLLDIDTLIEKMNALYETVIVATPKQRKIA